MDWGLLSLDCQSDIAQHCETFNAIAAVLSGLRPPLAHLSLQLRGRPIARTRAFAYRLCASQRWAEKVVCLCRPSWNWHSSDTDAVEWTDQIIQGMEWWKLLCKHNIGSIELDMHHLHVHKFTLHVHVSPGIHKCAYFRLIRRSRTPISSKF